MRENKYTAAVAFGLLLGCNNGGGDGNGDASDSMSSSPVGTGEESATTPTASGSAEGSSSTTSDDASEDEGPSPRYDVLRIPDVPGTSNNCEGKGGGGNPGQPEFSYLWASNSGEGTISKIDTQKVIEVARYQTRPDTGGSPSRTSVSLSGHAAVANRNGGITKFYARPELCAESNGDPGLQTSEGATALPWDEEECRAWYTEFDYTSQRPVAWAPGEFNNGSCTWENEQLWTAGRYGSGGDQAILLDGDTGVVIDMVDVPGLKPDPYGMYGGAVDSEGNFWATGWASGNHLVRVDRSSMEVTVWDGPSSTGNDSHWYGMTVDVNGYVWNCASRVARFDPDSEEWEVSDELDIWAAGCMADADPDGLLWVGQSGFGVAGIDRETFEVVHEWPTPDSYGISIDYYGYVWAVNGNGAYRVDPENGDVTSYTGLVGAYTYSDMTGYALSVVGGFPPQG